MFCRDLECDDVEWARGQAWAFEQAMGAVWYYVGSDRGDESVGDAHPTRILADTMPGIDRNE